MQRRKFLTGIGSLAAGGAAVTGTGAFLTMDAERSGRAKVKSDRNAAIQLTPLDDDYAKINGRTLSIKADLVNDDAITRFGPIFQVGNRDNVANDLEDYRVFLTVQSNLFSTNEDDKGDRIVQFDYSGGQLNTTDNTKPGTAPVLGPGETVDVSMTLDTRDLKNIAPGGSGDYKLFKQMTVRTEEV